MGDLDDKLFDDGQGPDLTDGSQGKASPEDTDEKKYTEKDVQEMLDKAVGRKLQSEGFYDHKEIVDLLKDFGYEGTPAEIKVILREQAKEAKIQREQAEKQQELEDLKDQANRFGTDPELLAEIRGLKKKIDNLEQEKQEAQKQQQARLAANQKAQNEVDEFVAKYPDIDHAKLSANEKFNRFYRRADPRLTLTEIYEDFVELVGEVEKAAIEKTKSNLSRSTGDGKAKLGDGGGTYGLTARQQELAKEAGIPFKKFAESLSLITKK